MLHSPRKQVNIRTFKHLCPYRLFCRGGLFCFWGKRFWGASHFMGIRVTLWAFVSLYLHWNHMCDSPAEEYNTYTVPNSNIWSAVKRLCAKANVNPGKEFPHNLRKLFARTFYSMQKDIAKLADILGHRNINATRIYIMITSVEHRKQIERLSLLAGTTT